MTADLDILAARAEAYSRNLPPTLPGILPRRQHQALAALAADSLSIAARAQLALVHRQIFGR